jgi:hypothetical protein
VEGPKLVLRVERLYSNDFPEQGELLIDRFAANAAIECQRNPERSMAPLLTSDSVTIVGLG